ncbi:MAG TPA: hypothetical protein VFI08_12835, partial [Spirochaetia bacterium]|nr:hypothetical protein [Spirochaetia bacterium]
MSAISWLRLGVRTAFLSAVGAVAISVCGCAVFSGMVSNSNPDWDDPYGPPSGAAVPASAGASAPSGSAARGTYRSQEQVSAPVSPDEKAVIASAQVLMGKAPESHATVNGRTFVLDCIGTVSAIFYGMNIDVQRDFRRYAGDG